MSGVDNRVVNMQFNNKEFEKGASTTIGTLGKLNESLNFKDGGKGLKNLQAQASRFNLGGMEGAIGGVSAKFIALSTIGITALSNITNKAINAGTQLAKSLTIAPISSGFSEYELKMGSIQTILSNTARYGTKLPEVTKNLDNLNHYADKTIYNFGQMTKNIGLFTNAGIKIGDATSMIKGFSNEAAASGTSAEGAASAAYQLSQALSAGKVTLMDWRSLQNVGMGNKNMQKGILDIAEAMGTLKKHGQTTTKVQKDFNGSLKSGWLTADVMSKYLKIMAGDMTTAQMKAMGLSKTQIKAFKIQQKNAEDAATKVRTWTQLIGTLQESVGSGWGETFGILIGDFNQATDLFTGVNDTLGGMISGMSDARNKLLKGWVKLGGRDAAINTVKNAFQALMNVLKPIHDAFRDVFPATTAKQLFNITKTLENFTARLKMGAENMDRLKRTFTGIFSVFDIGWEILKGVLKLFFSLFSLAGKGSGGILALTATVGDFLTKLNEWVTSGNKIGKFFDLLISAKNAVLQPLVEMVTTLVEAFAMLVKGDTAGAFAKMESAFSSLNPLIDSLKQRFGDVVGFISAMASNVASFFQSLGNTAFAPIVHLLSQLSDSLGSLKDRLNFKIGIDGTQLVSANKGVSKLKQVGEATRDVWRGVANAFNKVGEIAGPVLKSIGTLFATISDKLSEYIKGLDFQDAVALLNTGFFIAMYAALRKFLKNLDGLFSNVGDLIDSVKGVFDQLTSSLKTMQQNVRANIILKIAGAVALLTASLYALSKINGDDLKKALVAMTVMFAQLMGTLALMTKMDLKGKMTGAATALVLMATAMRILAGAVQKLGELDTGTLIKGLLALQIMMSGLSGMAMVLNGMKGLPAAALGLLILAAALSALSVVLRIYAAMDWSTILSGLAAVSLALIAIGLSMKTMPGPKGAIALAITSGALLVLAGVLKIFGSMDVGTIAKALITLNLALMTIVGGLNAMQVGMKGAAALLIVVAALSMLTPVLVTLGMLSWEAILKGLVALAGVFAVIGLAGLVLTPVIPAIMALGIAIGILGAAMLMAGTGFFLFATGFAALAALGAAGFAVLIVGFEGLLNLIPLFAQQIGLGLIAFAKVITDSGPKIVDALVTILMSLLRAIDKVIPKFVDTIGKLVMALVNKITELIPKIAAAGLDMIIALLNAVASRVGKIVDSAVKIIVNFITALGNGLPKIIAAGVDLILKFIEGVSKAINDSSERLGAAGGDMAVAIVKGVVKGLLAGIGQVVDAAKQLAKGALDAAKHFLGIHSPSKEFEKIGKFVDQGFAKGILGSREDVTKAMNTLNQLFKDTMASLREDVKTEQDKLNKLLSSGNRNSDEIAKARQRLAEAKAMEKATKAARDSFNKDLKDERANLLDLAKSYEDVTAKIEDAKNSLEDMIKSRDDLKKSVTAKFSSGPGLTDDTTVSDYTSQLLSNAEQTDEFLKALDQLANMGLDDATYQKILDEGLGAKPFVDELIAAGPAAVEAINKADLALGKAAKNLGESSSKKLYDAGINAAKGLLDGLESQKASIAKKMTEIANIIEKTIKSKLKIKSPSRVMSEIGRYATEGLARGMDQYSNVVKSAAEGVSDTAVQAIKDTMATISDELAAEVDMNPVIAPVLDLTQMKKDASKMSAMMNPKTLAASVSYGQAMSISSQVQEDQPTQLESELKPESKTIEFKQYNYSPKALSEIEIYRQTRNQLALAKEALSNQ